MARDLLPLVRAALGDRYLIESEIGRGAAAVVFRATCLTTGEVVALKILRPELVVSVTAERFLREIQIISRLDHPKIGRLLDSGEKDWLVYYVMPYFEGPSLQSVLKEYGRISVAEALGIAIDLLDALIHSHQHNIVHRDVKPDNILITREGAVLLDFGIARAVALSGTDRLTRSGIAVGTSHYMSPEQIMATDEPDPRADLYSLGCVLFECLAGQPPYDHHNEVRVMQLHQLAPVPDIREQVPGIPEAFAQVISRALAKPREERWQSAQEMLNALAGVRI